VGGIGTYTATTASALVRRGHDVAVVAPGEEGVAVEAGVKVVRLRPRSFPSFVPRRDLIERLWGQVRIARACQRFRPDVVQAPEWQAQAWLMARCGRTPVVTRLATPTWMVDDLNAEQARQHTTVLRWLERDQARRSKAVFAPTHTIADMVSARWQLRDAVAIVPNPVDVQGIRRAGRCDPPVPTPSRSIVFIGRLERRKGIATLGEALPEVLRAYPDVQAVLIGRDVSSTADDLMARFRRDVEPVAGRVHLLGEVPQPAALASMARATVVVLPSLWESFGYVCVEAMALGRPVVASDGSGFAEIIRHGIDGWLVPPGNPSALAQALVELLGDDARLQRIGAAATARADDFNADRIAEDIEAVYRRAMGACATSE
jgi:glycogen(starch) synthase